MTADCSPVQESHLHNLGDAVLETIDERNFTRPVHGITLLHWRELKQPEWFFFRLGPTITKIVDCANNRSTEYLRRGSASLWTLISGELTSQIALFIYFFSPVSGPTTLWVAGSWGGGSVSSLANGCSVGIVIKWA